MILSLVHQRAPRNSAKLQNGGRGWSEHSVGAHRTGGMEKYKIRVPELGECSSV